jgi:hypothetical protein
MHSTSADLPWRGRLCVYPIAFDARIGRAMKFPIIPPMLDRKKTSRMCVMRFL